MSALSGAELEALARSFAADRASWEHLVRADDARRVCEPLLRSAHATVWLLCWMPWQDTGFHDHDGVGGALAVVRGRVVEERLRIGGPPQCRELRTGESITFDGSVIHRVAHSEGEPAVTVHAYSPALRRMGAYDLDPSGVLRRRALDEDVELGAVLS
jgi:predicted metal-dependent enzyme (double-stranded beta helix superfamily)